MLKTEIASEDWRYEQGKNHRGRTQEAAAAGGPRPLREETPGKPGLERRGSACVTVTRKEAQSPFCKLVDTLLLYPLSISWLEMPSNEVLTAEDTEEKVKARLNSRLLASPSTLNWRLVQPEALLPPPWFWSFLLGRPVLACVP